jgi:elongation factor G
VAKGVEEAMTQGVLAGYPVVDLRAVVYDGSFHPVDSSDIAFKIAAQLAFKAAAEKAQVALLEPIQEVTITVPDESMGDVIGDLNARRGKILGMSGELGFKEIKALIPQAELFKYSTILRSLTQGRGYFKLRFHHYEEVPREIANRLIEETKKKE